MTTLVVCLDRTGDIGRKIDSEMPVAGWSRVESTITDIGLADPEDSTVNTLLEGLRVTRSLRDNGQAATIAVVSGVSESVVSADRAVARQLDALVSRYNPDQAIVVIDSPEDEQLLPLVESRIAVDSVDRVVVRQARDLESTYYLIKQFLADEELRQTTLVPLGTALVVFPGLAYMASIGVALAVIIAVIGLFLLFKGVGMDAYIERLVYQAREALYSGQVSVVTYVVAGGLALIGAFFGALGVSELGNTEGQVVLAMQFIYDAIPWLAGAALTASAGRLLDELLETEAGIGQPYLNLPFFVVAVGLIVRGFSAYFLEQAGAIGPTTIPALSVGPVSISAITLQPGQHLAGAVIGGLLVSLVGVRIATYIGESDLTTPDTELESP